MMPIGASRALSETFKLTSFEDIVILLVISFDIFVMDFKNP